MGESPDNPPPWPRLSGGASKDGSPQCVGPWGPRRARGRRRHAGIVRSEGVIAPGLKSALVILGLVAATLVSLWAVQHFFVLGNSNCGLCDDASSSVSEAPAP